MNIDWTIIAFIILFYVGDLVHIKFGKHDPTAHMSQSVGHALANITAPIGQVLFGVAIWVLFNHDAVGAALTRIVDGVAR